MLDFWVVCCGVTGRRVPVAPPLKKKQNQPCHKPQPKPNRVQGGLSYAIDLVRLIRAEHGDHFCIAVAGHPEGHLQHGSDAPAVALDQVRMGGWGDWYVCVGVYTYIGGL